MKRKKTAESRKPKLRPKRKPGRPGQRASSPGQRASSPLAAKPTKRKPGRPPREFTQAIADRICEEIIAGKSLRAICRIKAMPSTSTVMKWLRERAEFAQQYARAREEQADGYADQLMELSKQANATNAHAIRVRADIIKWVCAKLKPRRYGDRVGVDFKDDTPPREVSNLDLARWLFFEDHKLAHEATNEEFATEQARRLGIVSYSLRARRDSNGQVPAINEEFAVALDNVGKCMRQRIGSEQARLPAPDPSLRGKGETTTSSGKHHQFEEVRDEVRNEGAAEVLPPDTSDQAAALSHRAEVDAQAGKPRRFLPMVITSRRIIR